MSRRQPPLARGALVGDYRIDAILGVGSFAITYRVTDTILGLQLALKEYLPQDMATRDASGRLVIADAADRDAFQHGLEQFLAEGRVVAGLNHPNVVKVVRHFEAMGTAYLAMTYYEGEPLHQLLRRGGVFNGDEIRALARPLLDALAYLHERGVVHRDIKPANLYVTRDGQPILLDFGAARVKEAQGDDVLIGSEGYAAWEQFEPDVEVGPWTDLYGLAATFYRLSTGGTPTPAQERRAALAAGRPDPLKPLKPSRRIDRGLAEAILYGLAVEPTDRPPSASAWAPAFRPVSRAAPATGRSEETEWLPRLLAVFVGLALIAAVLWLWLGDAGRSGSDPAQSPGPALPPAVPTLAEDEASWTQAVAADTAEAYRAYLDAFPQGRYVDDAMAQLRFHDEEQWQQADAANTLPAYEAYLEAFPDGAHQVEARARLEAVRQRAADDDAAWESARRERTAPAVEAYLQAWPEGRHIEAARALAAQIRTEAADQAAFAAARRLNRASAYQDYLDAFPAGAHVAEALAALDDLTLRPGKRFRDCPDCPEMVVLPPGNFEQGSEEGAPLARSNESPRHTVRISDAFAMGVHEVTFREWSVCVTAGACRAQPRDNGWGRGDRPVMMVTWNDARDYVGWLSQATGETYDLPSESQWEYAARAGETGDWVGGGAAAVCTHANVAGAESGFPWRHDACEDPFSAGTATVGYFAPNDFGLHDMIGNVAEWTADCMNLSYLDAPADGSAWSRGLCASRLTRGGSWFSGSHEIRLPARFPLKAGERNDFTGFRVVRRVRE